MDANRPECGDVVCVLGLACPYYEKCRASFRAAAAALGRRGGKSTSDAKRAAARANGRKGGRPKKANP